MPKRGPDACMFCGGIPCQCNAKPPKAPRVKASSDLDRMRERAARRVEKPARPAVEHKVNTDEAEFSHALSALAGMLHPTELTKYAGILGSEVSAGSVRVPQGRILEWKRRLSTTRLETAHPQLRSQQDKSQDDSGKTTHTAGG